MKDRRAGLLIGTGPWRRSFDYSINKLMVRSIKAAISYATYIASRFARSHIAADRHVFLKYKKKAAKVG